jgi:hypothetical protein
MTERGTGQARTRERWEWPFTLSDLTAGLRRHLDEPSLQVTEIEDLGVQGLRPAIGRVRTLRVHYRTHAGEGQWSLVVKEPHGTTRTGLAGVGLREVGFYQKLAQHLPLETPRLIAGSSVGDWLLLQALAPMADPEAWTSGDYQSAIENLTQLHARFWNLEADLAAFPWLSRPLTADFGVHVTAAANAIEHMVHEGHPGLLTEVPERMRVLAALTMEADRVVEPLRSQPSTLLHGDYWPGNIAILEGRRQVVYDWQLAGIGPGVIDLLVFINKSEWWFDHMPVERGDIVEVYQRGIEREIGYRWDRELWSLLWDHALMWRFLQEWVDLLAASPDPILETRAEQLDDVWLEPVARAVSTRLERG